MLFRSGLDPQGMKEVRELVLFLSREKGKTVFLSSHILREVEIIANRMIIINKGTTQVEGEVSELLDSQNVTASIGVNNTGAAMELISRTEWKECASLQEGSGIVMNVGKDDLHRINKLLVENNIQVNSLVPSRSLEEYFLKITEGEGK